MQISVFVWDFVINEVRQRSTLNCGVNALYVQIKIQTFSSFIKNSNCAVADKVAQWDSCLNVFYLILLKNLLFKGAFWAG